MRQYWPEFLTGGFAACALSLATGSSLLLIGGLMAMAWGVVSVFQEERDG